MEVKCDVAPKTGDIQGEACRMFLDGYRAEQVGEDAVLIRDPGGKRYRVNTLFATCTCAPHRHTPCLHLLGYATLLFEQQAYEEALIASMEAQYGDRDTAVESDRLDRMVRETGFCGF